jgi:Flp pilus assembly pilin Flp
VKRLTAARKSVVKSVTGREEGVSIVETGPLLALIALVCFAATTALGTKINSVCSSIVASI